MIQDFIFKSDFKVCSNHREQIIHIRLLHCELEQGSDHHQCSQDCLPSCMQMIERQSPLNLCWQGAIQSDCARKSALRYFYCRDQSQAQDQ